MNKHKNTAPGESDQERQAWINGLYVYEVHKANQADSAKRDKPPEQP